MIGNQILSTVIALFLSVILCVNLMHADSLVSENPSEVVPPGFQFVSQSIGLEGDVEVGGILSLEHGIRFGDGTVQSTAAKGTPSEFEILVPSGSDAEDNGTRLLAALDAIDSANPQNILIKLQPGIYDLKSSCLEMKPGVHLEGAGERLTQVVAQGNETNAKATVMTAKGTVLSRLSIENTGDAAHAVGVLIHAAPAVMHRVTVVASGGSSLNYGVRILEADAVLDRVRATAVGGNVAYGVSIKNVERVLIKNTEAEASEATENNAFFVINEYGPPEMEVHFDGVSGTALKGTTSHAMRWIGEAQIRLRNSSLFAHLASSNYGVRTAATFSTPHLFLIETSAVIALGASSYGLYISSSTARTFSATSSVPLTVQVDHSRISGDTHTLLENNGAKFLVGATRLAGGPVMTSLGSATCAASYDGEYEPLDRSCLRQ